MVHTRKGYLAHGETQPFAFTKDIENAMVLNNYEEVKTLCDEHMMCAWIKESPNSTYRMCYECSKAYNSNLVMEV